MVSPADIYFVSTPYRVDLAWGQITEISMDTKRIQGGKATTVILVKSHGITQPYIFANFRDVNSAEQQLQKYLELSRAHAQELPAPQSLDIVHKEVRATSSTPAVQPAPSESATLKPKQKPNKVIGAVLLSLLTLVLVMTTFWWGDLHVESPEMRLSHLQSANWLREGSQPGLYFLALGTSILTALCLIFVGFY